ncbi:unnamed protein product, partial [Didymodactylos carnosus]
MNELYVEIKLCSETLTTLTQGALTLENDSARLTSEGLKNINIIQAIFTELNLLKKVVKEKGAFVNSIPQTQKLLQQVSSIREKVENLQAVSNDDTLLWKITEVSKKMDDAQSERQTSIFSQPFYSSPTGYKMRMRLCLYGDGNARSTHISLFFLLMQGEYDSLVKWPFNFKVTFCLYDQSGQNCHVVNSFQPDITLNSFQRPSSDMNIGSGLPQFFPLQLIMQAA